MMHGGRTGDNGHELKRETFMWDISRNGFTLRTARQQHRLPREAVWSPSMEAFKTQLSKALSDLV